MKKEVSASEIINQYIEYATIEGQTKLSGDYKTGNKMVKKMRKLHDKFSSDPDLSSFILNSIMDSDSIRAKGLAAADALRMGIHIDRALGILRDIASRNELGIWAFGAEMALKIWNEKGYLDP